MRKKIVIVGGGHAGGRCAELLLSKDNGLDVALLTAEASRPYQRPPLSKDVLFGSIKLEDCQLWRKDIEPSERFDLRLAHTATSIDRDTRKIETDRGIAFDYDHLVMAMGSVVRPVPTLGQHMRGVHCLRTRDDAATLRFALGSAKRLLVIGGGFIGLEVASTARRLGIEVTVVEASDRLLGRIVPPQIADKLRERQIAAGVDLIFGTMVNEFLSRGRNNLGGARLSTGASIECDVALIGVGASPNVSLARDCGLALDVGITTDSALTTSDPAISACGDIATFYHPLYGRHIRVEASQNAEFHAQVVAAKLTGAALPRLEVPYFWSDLADFSVQIMGLPYLGSTVLEKPLNDNSIILYHFDPYERIVGATGLGNPSVIGREVRRGRTAILAQKHYADLARDLD